MTIANDQRQRLYRGHPHGAGLAVEQVMATQHEPLSAEEVYLLAGVIAPGICLSTVRRNLARLRALGRLTAHTVPGSRRILYQPSSRT